MDALAYDPEDLEELLYFSGSDSDEHPPEPPPASSTILPPLHFVDMPSRSPYLSASKASQLSKLGVLNSPFGKYPKQRPSPKMKAPSPLTRFVPEIILPTNMTSPSKLMTFKTNDIIKHGELKLYMCRYTTIQPLFCIPFHETTTLQACRTLIDDLLMVDAIEYVFVAPTGTYLPTYTYIWTLMSFLAGKSIAVSAEGRFHAHWFYPVLTILVTSVLNQTSHHVSPDKLQQTMAALDQKSPASNEKPWNLSYASFGMFSSKELRMQSAIIQRRKNRHIKIQRKALQTALNIQEKVIVLQCWWRTMLSYRALQEKKQAHVAAIRIQSVMRQRSLQLKQLRVRRNSIRYAELERRREMVRKSQENFERERALAQLRKLHAKERKERKELNKLAVATRRERAAVAVQTTYRRYRAGKMVLVLRRERKAAIKIQAHLRKNTALTRVPDRTPKPPNPEPPDPISSFR
ncbi:hypothetical protein DYB28_001656 [Aphanomyces astaci]|uniref:Uncharacterized protein n=1 Tax=Aphanomyces astaci TaxID=112090 RepID=A0A9X8H9P0_APHAT|nr:hypothetical protein DYB28_001656 [Aphanomyces astaci]